MSQQGTKQNLGTRGEEVAEQYLKEQGHRILVRNWSVKGKDGKMAGELDIVAKKGRDIVFVEVKAGSSSNPAWRPEIHVTSRKTRRLLRAAQLWLAAQRLLDAQWRVDVVAVDFSHEPPQLRHFPNAVTGE